MLTPVPIAFWDERLSTSAMQRFLIEEADVSRKRRGEVIDKLAATHILQGALDFMKYNVEPDIQVCAFRNDANLIGAVAHFRETIGL